MFIIYILNIFKKLFSAYFISLKNILPSLAPTMNSLLAVSRVPLTPPKVEQATNSAMIQAMEPYSLLEKVTATASEPSTSDTESVLWNETMVKK